MKPILKTALVPLITILLRGNKTKFELVESSSYPKQKSVTSYWGSTVLTIYARAAITSPEVLKKEGEAVLTVLPAAEYLN